MNIYSSKCTDKQFALMPHSAIINVISLLYFSVIISTGNQSSSLSQETSTHSLTQAPNTHSHNWWIVSVSRTFQHVPRMEPLTLRLADILLYVLSPSWQAIERGYSFNFSDYAIFMYQWHPSPSYWEFDDEYVDLSLVSLLPNGSSATFHWVHVYCAHDTSLYEEQPLVVFTTS